MNDGVLNSQLELFSDKRVFEGLQLDARLRILLVVHVRHIRLQWLGDFGHHGIPNTSDTRPFPHLTFLSNQTQQTQHFILCFPQMQSSHELLSVDMQNDLLIKTLFHNSP
jgi:hypothetical protein